MCWAVNTSYATIVAPLGGMFLVENPPKPLPPTPPPSVSASEVWLEGRRRVPRPRMGVRGRAAAMAGELPGRSRRVLVAER